MISDEGEVLGNPHKVQVSDSGDYTTSDTFHVPPGINISYRLHSGGIYSGWTDIYFPTMTVTRHDG